MGQVSASNNAIFSSNVTATGTTALRRLLVSQPTVEDVVTTHPSAQLAGRYTFESSPGSANPENVFDTGEFGYMSFWRSNNSHQLTPGNNTTQWYVGSSENRTVVRDTIGQVEEYEGDWVQINFPEPIAVQSIQLAFNPFGSQSTRPRDVLVVGRNAEMEAGYWTFISQGMNTAADVNMTPHILTTATRIFFTSIRVVVLTTIGFSWPNAFYPPPDFAAICEIFIVAQSTRTVILTDLKGGVAHIHGGDIHMSRQTACNTTGGSHGAIVFGSTARDITSNDSARIVAGYRQSQGDNTGYLAFHTSSENGNSIERVRIIENGNVGVNTIFPTERLHVNGNAQVDGIVHLAGGNSIVGGNIDALNADRTYIRFGENGTTNDFAQLRQIGGADAMHMALDFHDNGDDASFSIRDVLSMGASADTIFPRLTVRRGGNVGIGLSDPSAPLHVAASNTTSPLTNEILVANSRNTANNQHAIVAARVGGVSAGNPFVSLDVPGGTGWSLGQRGRGQVQDRGLAGQRFDQHEGYNRLIRQRRHRDDDSGSVAGRGGCLPTQQAADDRNQVDRVGGRGHRAPPDVHRRQHHCGHVVHRTRQHRCDQGPRGHPCQ